MTARFDLNVVKRTRITERTNFEARVQFLKRSTALTSSCRARLPTLDGWPLTQAGSADSRCLPHFTVSGTNDPGGDH